MCHCRIRRRRSSGPYKHYADDLHEVHNSKCALLKQYAETWATMTDQNALIYVRHRMEVDAEAQALPGKKAATDVYG